MCSSDLRNTPGAAVPAALRPSTVEPAGRTSKGRGPSSEEESVPPPSWDGWSPSTEGDTDRGAAALRCAPPDPLGVGSDPLDADTGEAVDGNDDERHVERGPATPSSRESKASGQPEGPGPGGKGADNKEKAKPPDPRGEIGRAHV